MKKMILFMVVMIHQSMAEMLPSDVQRIVDQRDAAIKKIDEVFAAELSKLKVKATDPKVMAQIDSLLSGNGNGGASVPEDPILGVWYFSVGGGQLRRYEFKADGTFTGVLEKGGISGKWVRDGKVITMYMNPNVELPWATVTQKPNGSIKLRGFHSKDEWEGRRADKW